MSQEQFKQLLRFFKVLGNESRLKILGLLADQERSVGELSDLLAVKEPTVSHHLSMMKEMGLVQMRADGNARLYQLNTDVLHQMSKDVFSQQGLATLVDDTAVDAWEQKVLRTFIDGQVVKAIPSQYKKQRVLLAWMAQKFQLGQEYSEREVNEIIKRHHADSAWFRRSLVDHKLMDRARGVYWRL